MTAADTKPARYGFEDAFNDMEANDWPASTAEAKPPPPRQEVERIAKRSGFSSREPKPAPVKEPEGQINIRAKQSVLDRFRDFGQSQTPKWPSGYVLERALEALEREMKREG